MKKLVLLATAIVLYLLAVSCGSYENCRDNVQTTQKTVEKSRLS